MNFPFPIEQKTEPGDILTRGDVIVNKIEVGDIHYEFEYNMCFKSEVIEKPTQDPDNPEIWSWKSRGIMDPKRIVNYVVNSKYSHYSSKLYTYEAYSGCTYV